MKDKSLTHGDRSEKRSYKEKFYLLFGPGNHPKAKRSTAGDDDDIIPTDLWIMIVNANYGLRWQ